MRPILFLPLVLIAGAAPAQEPVADPVPLQRLLIRPDQLPAELERVNQGTLKQLPRAQFERLVQRAARAGQSGKAPQLVEAHFTAELQGNALVDGKGEWKIINPGDPGALPLGTFSPAVQKVVWQDTQQEAILGDLDSKGLALWVERSGTRSLSLQWTARGSVEPGKVHFDLNLPGCAVATLELDLPADRILTISRDVGLLSGPRPANRPDRRLWKLEFSGQNQVVLTVRQTAASGRPALVLARLQSRQDLTPGQLHADFDFDLEVLHQAVREFVCEIDPGLRPYEVVTHNLEGWEIQPGADASAPQRLIVRLREPFLEARLPLLIRCLAPLATDKLWTSPAVRLVGAVPRGETLLVRIDPDVQLEDWQPGSFRLAEANLDPGLASQVTRSRTEGWQVLPLTAGLDSRPTPQRPTARVKAQGPDFRVRQQTTWQIDPDRATLQAQLTYEVARGRLFQLLVQLPLGWEADQVQLTPRDLLRNWAVLADNDRSILVVDLQRPLASAAPVQPQLEVQLRSARPLSVDRSSTTPFPDVVPLGAPRLREGSLAIHVDPRFKGEVVPPPGPGAEVARDYFFPFRGQPVEGTLRLTPLPAQVRARCHSQVVLAPGRAALVVRLELEPAVGNPETVELDTSVPVAAWHWTVRQDHNQVQALERLPGSSRWRLTLARPLRQRLDLQATLELSSAGPIVPAVVLAGLMSRTPLEAVALAAAVPPAEQESINERHWHVPLVWVPGAAKMDGEVILHLAGADRVQVDSTGLQEGNGGLAPSWRTFRYHLSPLALTLYGRPPAADRTAEAVADQAELTLYVEPNGRLLHHFRFQVWNWRQRTLPLGLSRQAEILAAKADGRWIDRLPHAAVTETPLDPQGAPIVLFELPVTAGAGWHRFEVVYAVPQSPFAAWARLSAAAPILPIRTLTLRRVWRLPPGFLPLRAESMLRLPGATHAETDEGSFSGPTVRELADALNLPFLPTEEWAERQQQLLADALANLRKQSKPVDATRLGPTLEQLAFEHAKDEGPLLLDVVALRAAGLEPDTPIPDLHIAGVDDVQGLDSTKTVLLVYVPCRAGALLTTWRQWISWRAAGPITTALEESTAEAAALGYDRSGRFCRLAEWLRDSTGPDRDDGTAPVPVARLLADGLGAEWTEWEPLAGDPEPQQLTVIRRDLPGLAGLLLAVGLILIASRPSPSGSPERLVWLLGTVAVAGLGVLWLPATLRGLAVWPALAGIAVSAWVLLFARPRRPVPPPPSSIRPVPITAAVLVLLVLAGAARWLVAASEPAPTPVLIVPGPAESPEQHSVLVSPELLNQLEALAQQGTPRGVVPVSAAYEGRTTDTATAQLKAAYRVYAFEDEAAWLTLPLAGVQLQAAWVDGAPSYPKVVAAPREGFAVKIVGVGWHTVELQFAVPLTGLGEEHDLRCSIPELAQNRMQLALPAGVAYVHAHGSRGALRLDPGADDDGAALSADLGRISALHVRWRQEGERPRAAAMKAEIASLWELNVEAPRLLSVVRFTIREGAASRFAIDIPKDTEVRSVEAESNPLTGNVPAPRLRDWHLVEIGGNRRLQLDFQGPLTGTVQVTLELVPRQPFGPSAALFFPNPVVTAPGNLTQAWLAYRVDGLDATLTKGYALSGINAPSVEETFLQNLARPWRQARREDPALPAKAFWGTPGGNPQLQLSLQMPPSRVQCQQDVTWTVGRGTSDVRARLQLSHPDTVAVVEWEVAPQVAVATVSGPDVRSWSRTGGRVQVWFQRPVAQTNLQLTGWLTARDQDPARFTLPLLRVAGILHPTVVQLVAIAGHELEPRGVLQNLRPQFEAAPPLPQLRYVTDQATYGGTFQLERAAAAAELALLTFAEVRDRRLIFITTLDYQANRGQLQGLTLGLRRWEGGVVELEAPAVAGQSPKVAPRRTAAGRTWTVEWPNGAGAHTRLTLTGSVPVEAVTEVLMPDVWVEGTKPTTLPLKRWLAVAGPELAAEAPARLGAIADPVRALPAFHGEMERVRRAGGVVWQVQEDDWRLRLRLRSRLTAGGPVQVFLTEHHAAMADGQFSAAGGWHWLHEGTYRLYHEAGADLTFHLPAGAQILGVRVDRAGVPPLQQGPDKLWLALPGGAGSRTVHLRWTCDPPTETLERPNLATPQIDGVASGPVLWTVDVPPGYRADASAEAVRAVPADAIGQELRRATAELRLCQLLGDQFRSNVNSSNRTQLVVARDRFERACRRAELLLKLSPGTERGPEGQTAAEWLVSLRVQFRRLAQTEGLDKLSAEPELAPEAQPPTHPAAVRLSGPSSGTVPARGTPMYWQAAGETPPTLRLVAERTGRIQQAAAFSVILVLLLVAAGGLLQVPRLGAWPELLAVLGGLGLILFGTGWGLWFSLLPAVWLATRLMQLIRWLPILWLSPVPAVAVDSGPSDGTS